MAQLKFSITILNLKVIEKKQICHKITDVICIISFRLQITIAEDTIPQDDMYNDELISEKDDNGPGYHDSDEVPENLTDEEFEGSGDLPLTGVRGGIQEEKLAEEKLPEVGSADEKTESQCKQVNSADGVSIDCQGQNLESVLKVLDPSVTVLYLGNNAISELAFTAFPEKLDGLKQLSLKNNAIKSIDKNVS